MRELDQITARGRGTWGSKTYEIGLATNVTTRHDSTGSRLQTITGYHLLVNDPSVGRRRFRTETERAAFIEHSFTDVTLDTLTTPEEHERRHPLAGLIGEELAVVTFVRDYVQLNFDSPPLNLYVWPRIHRDGELLRRTDAGYADTLVDLINTRLTAADELLDCGLVLDFANDTRLTIPLDGTDLDGPEVAEYTDPGSERWMVWRPGDEPIEWLTPPE